MIKRADWVTRKGSTVVGIVTRVARNGSWADVTWNDGRTKRMQTNALDVQTTINVGPWTFTDHTRKAELQREREASV